MNKKPFSLIGIAILCTGALGMEVLAGEPKVRVETTMENFEITEMMVGCPQDGTNSAFVLDAIKLIKDINDRDADKLDRLLRDFDSANGVKVEGRTKVQNFQTQKDWVKATTRGPNSGPGKRLCDFLRSLQ